VQCWDVFLWHAIHISLIKLGHLVKSLKWGNRHHDDLINSLFILFSLESRLIKQLHWLIARIWDHALAAEKKKCIAGLI